MKLISIIISFVIISCSFAKADILYVPDDYGTIQHAIDSALAGDIVLVADGIYTGTGNRDIDFNGKAITVKSENGPETCIIDCGASEEDQHRGFYFHNSEGLDSIIDGFTITNGVALSGGGIKCEQSSPTIKNCIIKYNTACGDYTGECNGGGIYASEGAVLISGCKIESNNTVYQGNNIYTFHNNATIEYCSFNNGNIRLEASEPIIRYNSFTGSIIDFWLPYGEGPVSPIVENNILQGDETTQYHGLIYMFCQAFAGGGIYGVIRNNLIMNTGIGIEYRTHMEMPAVTGNIIVYCNQGIDLTYEALIEERKQLITYNNLWGNNDNYVIGYGASSFDLTGIQGNISEDPLFTDIGYGDFHISKNSPCIDAADPLYVPDTEITDYDGFVRMINDRVDIGPYEFTSSPIANAGPNQTVDERSTVTLDASRSYDNGGGAILYEWTQISGTSVMLSDIEAVNPTFIAPEVETGEIILIFELTVTDTDDFQSTDTVTITVENIDTVPTCVSIPEKPVALLPADGSTGVNCPVMLTASAFTDPLGCTSHAKSQWKLSIYDDFSGQPVFITKTFEKFGDSLTEFWVHELLLAPNTTYYWTVRYWGENMQPSEWSDPVSFTTSALQNDNNDNGIPDDQEVDALDDINNDGTPDNEQSDNLKSIRAADGEDMLMCIYPQDSQITEITTFSDSIMPDDLNRPDSVPYGLINFRLPVDSPGQRVVVKVHLSTPAPDTAYWVHYDGENGWIDYSDHAEFNITRDVITLEFKDGGYGDSDLTENSIIIDPSGLAETISEDKDDDSSDVGDSSSGSSGGGCFINTIIK